MLGTMGLGNIRSLPHFARLASAVCTSHGSRGASKQCDEMAVERLALRAVAPRRAARRLRPPGAGSGSGRPLCAGGVVAARPLPPPNGHAIIVSGRTRHTTARLFQEIPFNRE